MGDNLDIAENVDIFDNIDDKVARICRAAINIFYHKRFDKTTVSEITREAKVGKGTFYLYFDSKEDLLHYLIEYGIDRLISYVSERIKNGQTPKLKLENAVDAQLEFFNKHQEYFSFFIREVWSYREGLKEQIEKLKSKYISLFEDVINQGIKEKNFVNINPETVSSGLFGFLSISSCHWLLFSEQFPLNDINADLKKVFFEGLMT